MQDDGEQRVVDLEPIFVFDSPSVITPAVKALQVMPVKTVPPMKGDVASSTSWLTGLVWRTCCMTAWAQWNSFSTKWAYSRRFASRLANHPLGDRRAAGAGGAFSGAYARSGDVGVADAGVHDAGSNRSSLETLSAVTKGTTQGQRCG